MTERIGETETDARMVEARRYEIRKVEDRE